MHKNYLKVITLAFLVLGATAQAQAQSANAPYPVMAPLDQYLIPDEKSEITLAVLLLHPPFRTKPKSWCWGGADTRPP